MNSWINLIIQCLIIKWFGYIFIQKERGINILWDRNKKKIKDTNLKLYFNIVAAPKVKKAVAKKVSKPKVSKKAAKKPAKKAAKKATPKKAAAASESKWIYWWFISI